MLLTELASEKALRDAWDSLQKYNTESHGLSGETIGEFKENIDHKISLISEKLLTGKYQFRPTRAFLIPKDKKDSYRPLQIPEIEDRLLSKALAILLERQLKATLVNGEGVSFAYQKGLGVKDAIEKMLAYYSQGYTYIFEADIIKFFPSVDKELLLKNVFTQLPDSSINNLIKNAISQSVGGLDSIEDKLRYNFDDASKGIPQGNPLSPLFSNFFLATFDKKMKDEGFKLIRYADDFIVMCKDETEAYKAYEISRTILEGDLNLQLHDLSDDGKTRIVNPSTGKFSFLSIEFDGRKIYPSNKAVDSFLENIFSICYQDRGNKKEKNKHNVITILIRLKNSIEGWVSTYFYTDIERYFEKVETIINKHLYIALNDLEWTIVREKLGNVKGKYRYDKSKAKLSSKYCLSDLQRKNSGIPTCYEILSKRRASANNTTKGNVAGLIEKSSKRHETENEGAPF